MQPGPHKHAKVFYKVFAAVAAGLLLCVFGWMGWALSSSKSERTKNLALVHALNVHRDKVGSYPARLEELRTTNEDFDLTPFEKYDQSADCPTMPSYCFAEGRFAVTYPDFGMVYCRYRLGIDTDFVCAD